jgi:TetR/AcrR family transcriptional repressor of nem operon
MRVSQQEKQQSRRRIVENAARLVRERGIERAGVADVMTQAGLTHGGFYRHFESKDALMQAALQEAFGQVLSRIRSSTENRQAGKALASFRAFYLSQAHFDHPGLGCPVAALAGEVAREPDALKAAFGGGLEMMAAALGQSMAGTKQQRRAAALRELAMLAGALAIARACDEATSRAVLDACRRAPPARSRFDPAASRP